MQLGHSRIIQTISLNGLPPQHCHNFELYKKICACQSDQPFLVSVSSMSGITYLPVWILSSFKRTLKLVDLSKFLKCFVDVLMF